MQDSLLTQLESFQVSVQLHASAWLWSQRLSPGIGIPNRPAAANSIMLTATFLSRQTFCASALLPLHSWAPPRATQQQLPASSLG